MRNYIDYRSAWLTINRICNLRCKWCYARGTDYLASKDMDYEMATSLVNLISDLHIKNIILIGGEPTLYPGFLDLIDYIHSKHIGCGFVTNGLKYKDEMYVKAIVDKGVTSFSISLKGENKKAFKEISGKDAFDDVVLGVTNCLKYTDNVVISMVLTEENMPSYLEAVKTFRAIGVRKFNFSFCYDFDMNVGRKNNFEGNNPIEIVQKFKESYVELDRMTQHSFKLAQSFPLCIWDENLIREMNNKHQLSSVCQLLSRSGLLFDEEGSVIPCNAMYSLKLAKFNEDFSTADELIKLTKDANFKDVYKHLCGLPDKQCLSCDALINCGGGCVCQWTNYSFSELMNMRRQSDGKD